MSSPSTNKLIMILKTLVKYLVIQIDKGWTWKQQINHVALKLNKANAMLSKLRYGLGTKTLRTVYYAVFEFMLHLFRYKTLIFKRFHLLQKKSLRIMFFQNRNFQTGPLLQTSKILKTFNKAAFKNCIFIRKSLKGLLRSIFNNWFKFSFEPHSNDTR